MRASRMLTDLVLNFDNFVAMICNGKGTFNIQMHLTPHTEYPCTQFLYNDVIMGAISSQMTRLTIVCSIVYSDADQRKHQNSASLAFVRGIHRGPVKFPAQMASYAENVSIWWRHHGILKFIHKNGLVSDSVWALGLNKILNEHANLKTGLSRILETRWGPGAYQYKDVGFPV